MTKHFSRREFSKAAMAWTGLVFVPRHLVEADAAVIVPMTSRLPLATAAGGLSIVSNDPQTGAHAAPNVAGTTVHSLTGVAAGAVLVVSAANESDSVAGGAITVADSAGLTWTSQSIASAANSGNARIYTAVFTAGGSTTVTVTHASMNATAARSSVCYVITGQEGTLGGAAISASNTALDQPNVTLTTTRASSLIICVCSDFAARAGTPTARLGTISLNHDATTASYRGVHMYHSATSATGYGMGYTGANTGGVNKCGVAGYEIRTP